MKKAIALVLISGILSATAMAGPLVKIDQDWPKARQIAAEQNKLILVDFYTTWCGPCKRLNKDIFEDSITTAEISKKFILLKYDAEKDSLHHLTMKFHVNAYPTSMVLSPDIKLYHKELGYESDPADKYYLSFLQQAVKNYESGTFFKGVSDQIELDFPDFYRHDILSKKKDKERAQKIEAYWSKDRDITTEVNFALMYFYGVPAKHQSNFISKIESLKALYGNDDVMSVTEKLAEAKFEEAVEQKSDKALKNAVEFAKPILSKELVDQLSNHYNKEMYIALNDWTKYTEQAEKELGSKKDPHRVNEFAWTIYEKSSDQAAIKKALTWMAEAVKSAPEYALMDTYACLLFKSGNKKRAIEMMKSAIETGKKNGEKVKDSETMLDKWVKSE